MTEVWGHSAIDTVILMEFIELVLTAGSPVPRERLLHKDTIVLIKNVLRESLKGSGLLSCGCIPINFIGDSPSYPGPLGS